MQIYHLKTLLVLIIFGLLCSQPASASIKLGSEGKFSVYGDFRTRFEADWDSSKSNGNERDDRNRLRIRARIGVNYQPNDFLTFGLRARTGSDDSHQSPHITVLDFDDNDTGDADVNLDKWFLKAKKGGAQVWVGRNSLQFWKQNEMFWDDDVTPAGLGFGYKKGSLQLNLGYFSLPVGMQEFAGNVGTLQIVFDHKIGGMGLKIASGVLSFESDGEDKDSGLLNDNNGNRDYNLWVSSLQLNTQVAGRPFRFTADFIKNTEDYSANDPDPFTAFHHDQDTGYVFSGRIGKSKQPGDWLFAYYYAQIETLAVNSSYAQDDWMRFGSAVEARGSNFDGHELRVVYAVAKKMNLVARLYIVDAIEKRNAGAVTEEDGNRFRLDFNYKF